MKRFRLSTLMLLVVIAAMGLSLIIQEVRYRHREAKEEERMLNWERETYAEIMERAQADLRRDLQRIHYAK